MANLVDVSGLEQSLARVAQEISNSSGSSGGIIKSTADTIILPSSYADGYHKFILSPAVRSSGLLHVNFSATKPYTVGDQIEMDGVLFTVQPFGGNLRDGIWGANSLVSGYLDLDKKIFYVEIPQVDGSYTIGDTIDRANVKQQYLPLGSFTKWNEFDCVDFGDTSFGTVYHVFKMDTDIFFVTCQYGGYILDIGNKTVKHTMDSGGNMFASNRRYSNWQAGGDISSVFATGTAGELVMPAYNTSNSNKWGFILINYQNNQLLKATAAGGYEKSMPTRPKIIWVEKNMVYFVGKYNNQDECIRYPVSTQSGSTMSGWTMMNSPHYYECSVYRMVAGGFVYCFKNSSPGTVTIVNRDGYLVREQTKPTTIVVSCDQFVVGNYSRYSNPYQYIEQYYIATDTSYRITNYSGEGNENSRQSILAVYGDELLRSAAVGRGTDLKYAVSTKAKPTDITNVVFSKNGYETPQFMYLDDYFFAVLYSMSSSAYRLSFYCRKNKLKIIG